MNRGVRLLCQVFLRNATIINQLDRLDIGNLPQILKCLNLSGSKINNAVVILTKKQVSDSLLTDYMSRRQEFQEKLATLEQKYQSDLQTFETQLENSSVENFEAWDDLIQWKAYHQFLLEIETKITDIRNGDFQMAE